jgi:AcrB/AcrD/AcrF family
MAETPTPTHATKKAKRYCYYVSAPLLAGEGLRVSAGDIEVLVLDRLRALLSSRTDVSETLAPLDLDAYRDRSTHSDLSDLYAMTGGLLLQWYLGYNFSVAVWVGYIALFGIAVETGVVMVVYLHEALDRRLAAGSVLQRVDIEQAAIEGAVQRLRPKLMTVAAVLASLVPILWETGVGSDVMKPIAAPIVGGMITSTINVLILVPVFFVMMKARARQGKLQTPEEADA